MLGELLQDPLALRVAQAIAASLFAMAVALFARRQGVHIEWETGSALVRGIIQIIFVGLLLTVVFSGPNWTSALVLSAMAIAGAVIASRRAKHIERVFPVAVQAIVLGAGLVIVGMAVLGVLDSASTAIIPVGSMIIASSMNTTALTLDRFRAEVEAHTGQIEAGLALGAAPNVMLSPYVQAAVEASMIPSINSLRSLGIVWIPGLMAGMILAGGDPVDSALYQFVVIAMLYAAAGTTSIACALLIRTRAFTTAEQLTLRPQDA